MKLADISLSKNVKFNDKLNPTIWNPDNTMKKDVRKKLSEIGEAFMEYMELDLSLVEDYLVVGSMANYNWNQYSDIDLHILMDFQKVGESCNEELVEEYLMSKRAMWILKHDITIHGIQVEVGPQDTTVKLNSAAVFSVLENKWLKMPKKEEPKIDEDSYDKKLKSMVGKIDKVLSGEYTADELEKLQDEISAMRQSSLDLGKGGTEFSVNNLVFKTLRNQGLIDKIKELKVEKRSEELSL